MYRPPPKTASGKRERGKPTASYGSHARVAFSIVNNNPETMDLGRRSFPTAVGWFSLAQRSHECSRVPGAAQREAISVFTRVFDALWRNGALQAPISGLPEIGAHMRK